MKSIILRPPSAPGISIRLESPPDTSAAIARVKNEEDTQAVRPKSEARSTQEVMLAEPVAEAIVANVEPETYRFAFYADTQPESFVKSEDGYELINLRSLLGDKAKGLQARLLFAFEVKGDELTLQVYDNEILHGVQRWRPRADSDLLSATKELDLEQLELGQFKKHTIYHTDGIRKATAEQVQRTTFKLKQGDIVRIGKQPHQIHIALYDADDVATNGFGVAIRAGDMYFKTRL